ncbi:Predicted nuclease (RNAse H fold) [Caballeronia arationis]|uniref:Predicted nuclease (RNAse H fold) n=1 Tax=Caballeronia arationis TaxID=1777142 RepID=A0A7Z7I4R3_9BURK|nr:Predicted nuclease (RNAse H fold) [Caballeronia arationis]
MTGVAAARQVEAVAGIDVGGTTKGFHLVVLQGAAVRCVASSPDARELHQRCLQFKVSVVGIDAPSQWGVEGIGRAAEREMARERISCFATPTLARASASTSGFYEWMFNGARVYEAFADTHPILKAERFTGEPVTFETFPHAIACALLGRDVASAKQKRTQRRRLLEELGLDTTELKSIDSLDAVLCAVAAQRLIQGKSRAYGDGVGGYIFVPTPV